MTSELGLKTLQVTSTVALVPVHGAAPSGTGPSATVTVTATWPGAVHVKLVAAEFAAEKVPLAADHAKVSALALGAEAAADRLTVPPSTVSVGVAVMAPWKMLAQA